MFAVSLIVTFLLSRAIVGEQLCSKFSYDEALLEKMIRTEIKFEQLQTEFSGLQEELNDTYVIMSDDLNNMTTHVNNMFDAITVTLDDVRKGKHDMDKEFKSLNKSTAVMTKELIEKTTEMLKHKERKFERMLEEIQALYTELHGKMTARFSTPMISFKATDARRRTVSKGDVFDFPDILSNEGRAYDPYSGKFTAPVMGLYMFTVQVCPKSRNYFSGKIVKDEIEVGSFTAGDKYYNACNTGDVITEMDVGQNVYVSVLHGAALSHDSYKRSSFSGVLLHKTG